MNRGEVIQDVYLSSVIVFLFLVVLDLGNRLGRENKEQGVEQRTGEGWRMRPRARLGAQPWFAYACEIGEISVCVSPFRRGRETRSLMYCTLTWTSGRNLSYQSYGSIRRILSDSEILNGSTLFFLKNLMHKKSVFLFHSIWFPHMASIWPPAIQLCWTINLSLKRQRFIMTSSRVYAY